MLTFLLGRKSLRNLEKLALLRELCSFAFICQKSWSWRQFLRKLIWVILLINLLNFWGKFFVGKRCCMSTSHVYTTFLGLNLLELEFLIVVGWLVISYDFNGLSKVILIRMLNNANLIWILISSILIIIIIVNLCCVVKVVWNFPAHFWQIKIWVARYVKHYGLVCIRSCTLVFRLIVGYRRLGMTIATCQLYLISVIYEGAGGYGLLVLFATVNFTYLALIFFAFLESANAVRSHIWPILAIFTWIMWGTIIPLRPNVKIGANLPTFSPFHRLLLPHVYHLFFALTSHTYSLLFLLMMIFLQKQNSLQILYLLATLSAPNRKLIIFRRRWHRIISVHILVDLVVNERLIFQYLLNLTHLEQLSAVSYVNLFRILHILRIQSFLLQNLKSAH